jgi:hypothetical protein
MRVQKLQDAAAAIGGPHFSFFALPAHATGKPTMAAAKRIVNLR